MKTLLALAVATAFTSTAQAEEVTVIFAGFASHQTEQYYDTEKQVLTDWNETNDAIGIQYNGITFVSFTNSYYKQSYILAYDFSIADYDFTDNFSVRANFAAGVVKGYTADQLGDAQITDNYGLYLLPSATASYKINDQFKLNATFGILPSKQAVKTLAFSITYSF